MIYTERYIINQTPEFEKELEYTYNYLAFKLKEPITAKNFYNKVIKEIYSLQYLPERYVRIFDFRNKERNLRRLLVDNYVIIYEVNKNTRTSFCFTYLSWQSKLFKSIIKINIK